MGQGLTDSMRMQLRYVVEDVDRHGNVRVYLRRHGKKKRLHAVPGSPEFVAEYRAALAEIEGEAEAKRDGPAQQGSLRWLIEAYYRSAEFRLLTERTRHVRRGILDRICEGTTAPGGTPHGRKPFAPKPGGRTAHLVVSSPG